MEAVGAPCAPESGVPGWTPLDHVQWDFGKLLNFHKIPQKK